MDVRNSALQRPARRPSQRHRVRDSNEARGTVTRRLTPALAVLVAARPIQWIKNLTCLAGLLFSGKLFLTSCELDAAVCVGSFCLASSSVYIFNDIIDRHKDRLNPRTAGRPIASGQLSPRAALLCVAILATTSISLALSLGASCVFVLVSYLVLNLLYTHRLKHVAVADVMCIALGFVLRVLFGVYAVGALPTPWIVLCMFFLALFLGFAKRRAELVGLAEDRSIVRPVLGQYDEAYLNMALIMSAASAVLAYALFTVASHKNPTLVLTVVPVAFCINRYLLQVMVHGKGCSPDRLLLSDHHLWVGMSVWIAAYLAITYGHIHLFSVTGV